jgi:two-component system sensor histidine kinase BaeS
MSVRMKLFAAMAVLILFVGVAYLASSQGYLHNHLPVLVDAMKHEQLEDPGWSHAAELQQDIYNSMMHVAFKVIGVLSVIALLIGYWLSRVLTSPLHQLTAAIGRIGKGDLNTPIPVTTRDEYGQVADALNWMTASLSRSEEVRKHLVADIAHELRTPLTILQAKFEYIQQGGKAVEPETLLPMQDEVIRLNQLVNDLHQLSLAEAGKLPLNRKRTDIVELLEKLIDLFLPEAEDRGIGLLLTCSIADRDTANLDLDSHRMTQVFYNLIGNAMRHTPSGGHIYVELTEMEAAPNELIIRIRDTGEGISERHLPYVFDRFYRADDDRSRQSGGMGLGLAITKQFVEAHGGSIEVDSVLGEGTTFTVRIPRA